MVKTCNTCAHMLRICGNKANAHEFHSYCAERPSKQTNCGFKMIKHPNRICPKYTQRED